jgi:predicted ATPase
MSLLVREIRLRNFRGFRDARLPLDDVTFLVGRNGCGKSTLLDALDFVRDALTVSLGIALERRGGIHGVRHRLADAGEAVEVAVVLELAVKAAEASSSVAIPEDHLVAAGYHARRVVYGFSLDASGALRREVCRWEGDLLPGFEWREGRLTPFGGPTPAQPQAPDDALLLPLLSGVGKPGAGRKISTTGPRERSGWGVSHSALASLRSCHPNADAIREGSEIALGASLEPDARNLANVLWQIRERAKESEPPRFAEMLDVIVPGLREVRTINHGTRRTLEFVCAWEGREVLFPASAMSHGTLRALAMLVALHQPSEPAVVSIDEVENSLHLGALQVIFDEVIAATRERVAATDDLPKQVVVTTHSAEVLSLPAAEGRRVRVVERRGASSEVFTLASTVLAELQAPETVGRLLRIDALWPSQDPLRHEGDLMEP